MDRGITRRRFTAAASAVALAAAAGVRTARAEETVTFVAWGGNVQDAMKTTWTDPFEAAQGIKVVHDAPVDYGKLKAMVDAGNVVWDVVDVEGGWAQYAAMRDLLEPLDFSIIDKSQLDKRFVFDHGVGSYYFSYVLGYNKDVLGDKTPDGWAALFDTQTFPGRRAWWKWVAPGVLEPALLADGVPPDQLYPLDLDRVFKKLDTIKSEIAFWSSGAESQQLLASGEAPLGMFWNGRVHLVQQSGANVGISWAQNLALADYLVVPKGTKNKEAAMKLIAFIVSAKPQAEFDAITAYAPINKESVPMIPQEVLAALPTNHSEDMITVNLDYWADHRDEIESRWYAWQAK
jgi:putative spermidine/putrescine transport system substrate-binding protein